MKIYRGENLIAFLLSVDCEMVDDLIQPIMDVVLKNKCHATIDEDSIVIHAKYKPNLVECYNKLQNETIPQLKYKVED